MDDALLDHRLDHPAALLGLRQDGHQDHLQDHLQVDLDHLPRRAQTREDHRPLVDGDPPAVDCSVVLSGQRGQALRCVYHLGPEVVGSAYQPRRQADPGVEGLACRRPTVVAWHQPGAPLERSGR